MPAIVANTAYHPETGEHGRWAVVGNQVLGWTTTQIETFAAQFGEDVPAMEAAMTERAQQALGNVATIEVRVTERNPLLLGIKISDPE